MAQAPAGLLEGLQSFRGVLDYPPKVGTSAAQHMGMVYYDEVLNELIENNYFRSGSQLALQVGGGFDEHEFT